MKIRTVALLGAGAVGSYFIWGLSEKLGDCLWVIADGERKKRLEQEGIFINGKCYRPCVRTPKEAKGADLLLVSVKYGALPSCLTDISQIVEDHTIVLSLLNGVDSEEIIGRKIGMEHMLFSMMKIASKRVGNEIMFQEKTTIGLLYGEKDQEEPSGRMLAVEELLSGTGIHRQMCRQVLRDIWHKYAFNISMNLPQAVIGCGLGAYAFSENAAKLRWELRKEVCEVAAAKGINISELSDIEKMHVEKTPDTRYSTLQDLDAKRHTEIDMFSGTLMKLGRELGVPTPYNEVIYYMIKALEEKNDGKFDTVQKRKEKE